MKNSVEVLKPQFLVTHTHSVTSVSVSVGSCVVLSDLLPSPSSVTPSTRRSRHWACFLSLSSTSAYPGRRRNRPKAASEWAGMGDMVCTEDDDDEDDWDCCLLMGGGSAAMDSGASYTSSPDCSMVTHSNWSLSLGFSCVAEGTTGALTCGRTSGRIEGNLNKGERSEHETMLTGEFTRAGTLQCHDVANSSLRERLLAVLHTVNVKYKTISLICEQRLTLIKISYSESK